MRSQLNFSDQMNKEIEEKVHASLIHNVYMEADFALIASFFCALIVFAGIFLHHNNYTKLYTWFAIFLIITSLRFVLIRLFKHQQPAPEQYKLWRNLYTLGAIFGGLSWGFAATMIPDLAPLETVLIVLMLAGVTGGSVPLTVGVPTSAITFLFFSITPFIIYFVSTMQTMYLLFAAALTLYLIYSIVLTMRGSINIQQFVALRYENAGLLQNLSEAKYQLELTNEKLEYAATHDSLTHVASRNLFQANLEKAIQEAKQNNSLFALFYIDIDGFKLINDEYGHNVGDSTLVVIAHRLIHFFHVNEAVGRLGGEEFAVIIKDIKTEQEIKQLATQLCKTMAEPIPMQNIGKLQLTISVGISFFPHDGQTTEAMIGKADKAMYEAKNRGGNGYFYQDEKTAVTSQPS